MGSFYKRIAQRAMEIARNERISMEGAWSLACHELRLNMIQEVGNEKATDSLFCSHDDSRLHQR